MAHDVFISHSAKDKATADAVCAMLESEGIRCWIAPRDVLPSMEWGEAIIDALEQCRIMVLVFTANANDSPQIRREIERAVNRGVAILPLRVENVLPGKAIEFFIGNVHWLDALTPPFEAHLKNLAGTIRIVLARSEPGAAVTPSQVERTPATDSGGTASGNPVASGAREAAPAKHLFWSARAWTWAGGTVSALLLAAVFVGVHFTSHPAPGASPEPTMPPVQGNPGATAPGGAAPAATPLPTPAAAPGASKSAKPAVRVPDVAKDNAPSLGDTMRTLQSELRNIGTVSFTAFGKDTTDGSSIQDTNVEQVSNVLANPATCIVTYHWRAWRNGAAIKDADAGIPLRYVTSVGVEREGQAMAEANADHGNANLIVTSTTPPVTELAVRWRQVNLLPFADQALANRAAETITQAVKLCGGNIAN